LLEKVIVGIELKEREIQHKEKNQELMDKIMGKIKNIGMELHRAIPN
jgi:translation initiation factor IF-3